MLDGWRFVRILKGTVQTQETSQEMGLMIWSNTLNYISGDLKYIHIIKSSIQLRGRKSEIQKEVNVLTSYNLSEKYSF